jgi:hypothetical protein
MISANELRIGNWLDFNGKMQRVGLIDLDLDDEGEELVASIEEYDTTYILRNGKIKPIPLTPEILEACGFVNDSILLSANDIFSQSWELPVGGDGTIFI